jgi:hypothetical protein
MVCPRCGAQIEAQDKFCDTCGVPAGLTWSQTKPPPPPPPAQYGAAPHAAPQYGANPMAGLRALAGGLVAIASAWLPWINDSSGTFNLKPIDATDMSSLACGYYLLIGGGITAACGLLLLLRVGRSTSLPILLGIGAIAGGVLVVAVEAVAFGRINDTINLSIGYGLYVGIGAGVVGALGGLLGLFNRAA